ncbi:MAG: isoprenylcysteine carboxylmethyltransferase family protein [Deltaproteobacteria bacterium]|nr:isoprenylcysteine carboxylmethyltransferase family protein [Deltaproteobacteria bacterium]
MIRAKGYIALALPVVLFAAMMALGISAGQRLEGTDWLRACSVLCAYWGWMAVETATSIRERGEESPKDKGTLLLYAIGQGATVLIALALAPGAPAEPVAWAGVALFVVGVALRLYAVRTLGDLYSHRVRVQSSHRVISRGPYRFIRHPAYAGMLLAHLGFVLVFFHWLALAPLVLLLLPGVVLRITVEEKAMLGLDGYADYCARRKRLIPMVW